MASATEKTASTADGSRARCVTSSCHAQSCARDSPNIESVEPVATPAVPAVMNGIDAIRQKNTWWGDNNEVHSAEAHGPFVGENQFAVHYRFDTTFKPTGERKRMEEMALYTVKDGQIVREQFFCNLLGA